MRRPSTLNPTSEAKQDKRIWGFGIWNEIISWPLVFGRATSIICDNVWQFTPGVCPPVLSYDKQGNCFSTRKKLPLLLNLLLLALALPFPIFAFFGWPMHQIILSRNNGRWDDYHRSFPQFLQTRFVGWGSPRPMRAELATLSSVICHESSFTMVVSPSLVPCPVSLT